MTSIGIIGGTGYAGSTIAKEAVARGFLVTALSRRPAADPIAGVTYLTGSLADPAAIANLAATNDVVVLAVHAVGEPPLLDGIAEIAHAVREHKGRLGVVGGAGSSLVAPDGPRLIDTPEFQEEWKAEASAHGEVLEWLRSDTSGLRWFYVSPAALFGSFAPGEATGSYRTGGDVLVSKSDGSSEISGADFALAFVDEILTPAHENQRFTVGH